MNYLITYDLFVPGQDYPNLFEAIERLGDAKHGMQNVWFVKSVFTAREIRDKLKLNIDENDKLFVCEIGDWASSNLYEIGVWLNNNA